MQRLQREQRGRREKEGNFFVVGQSMLSIALNAAALISVLISAFYCWYYSFWNWSYWEKKS